jgi:hypothetical protein
MKKMQTLFEREFIKKGKRTINIITHDEISEGCEWVANEPIKAYRKIDGTCCLVEGGKIYKRYDFKKGRKLPEGAIPCQSEGDCVTGHFPHWVECKRDEPSDKYHMEAFDSLIRKGKIEDGTYELVGDKINGNKDKLSDEPLLIKHDDWRSLIENPPITFDEIRRYLSDRKIEGIVYYRNSGEMCKIKRSDFGLEW